MTLKKLLSILFLLLQKTNESRLFRIVKSEHLLLRCISVLVVLFLFFPEIKQWEHINNIFIPFISPFDPQHKLVVKALQVQEKSDRVETYVRQIKLQPHQNLSSLSQVNLIIYSVISYQKYDCKEIKKRSGLLQQ